MPAPDPAVVERQFWLNLLGWAVDDITYSLDDLKQRYFLTQTISGLDTNIRKEPGKPLSTAIATVGGGGVVATDTGDGGISLATVPVSKMTKYTYGESTYFKIANAVQLATNPPQPPSNTPSAGVTQRAAREDHVHLIPTAKPPSAKNPSSGTNGWLVKPSGTGTTVVNRAHFVAIWISTVTRASLTLSALGVYVSTAAGAGGTIRFCLYKATGTGAVDGANKVFESGEIASTSTGFKMASYAGPIPEGLYWWGVVMHIAACTIYQADPNYIVPMQHVFNTQDSAPNYYQDGVTGTFPTGDPGAPGGDITPAAFYTAA